jgi:hypothetical protein
MLLQLLIAYAICFGIQHKVPVLRGKLKLLDDMLTCTYCTGFHAGWMTWAFIHLKIPTNATDGCNMLAWCFASAAFCYVLDAGVQFLERGSK